MPAKPKRIDINPQFLNIHVNESAANTWTTQEASTPVFKQISKDTALVMEILKIYFHQVNVGEQGANDQHNMVICDRDLASYPDPDNAAVIAWYRQSSHVATSGAHSIEFPKEVDLTDGNGNGVLYGRQKIYLGIKGNSQASALEGGVKILYRLKEVSASELIGIIQE